MAPQEISFDRYNSLQREISENNDIQSALKEAYELIKGIVIEKEKNKKNPEKFKQLEDLQNKFIKEYVDLELSIRSAIKGDKSISKQEREKIMYELSDIVDLAQKNGIKEHKNLWSKLGDIKRSIGGSEQNVDTSSAKTEAMQLNEKKELITKYFKKEKFSETELKKLLTISNEERKKLGVYSSGNDAGKIASLFGIDSRSADAFLDQEEVIRTNQFQDDIIKRIGLEKGYNGNGDIHAYHSSMGNYITNTPNVESALKTNEVKDLGNKALKNYLSYIESKGNLNAEYLIKNFGKEKAKLILKFVDDNKANADITGAGFISKIGGLIEGVKNYFKEKIMPIFNKIKSSSNIDEFKNNLNSIKKLEGEEKKALLEEFDIEIKNKESALKKLFFEPVKAKLIKDGKTEAEANKEALEITDKTLNEIESNLIVSNLDTVFKIIIDFNKKYDAKLSPKRATADTAEVTGLKSKKKAVESVILAEEARKKGDTEGARKHENNAKSSMIRAAEAETVGKIVSKTSEQEANDIGTGKLDYKVHLSKILSEDSELKNEITKLESEKKKFENENGIDNNDTKNIVNNKLDLNPLYTEGNYNYNPENGSAKVGDDQIELSIEEQKLVEDNPETLKNIVDFYSTLNKVGLAKLWPIKEQIFNVIGSVKGVGFRIDQNYLSENETKIFLNAILKSTGEDTINPILGINDFIANIERKNNTQFSGAEAQVNKSGDTKIEQKFISSFAPRGNFLGFDSPAFEEKIRS